MWCLCVPHKNLPLSSLTLFYFVTKIASKRCCWAHEKFGQVNKVWNFLLAVFQWMTIPLYACSTYFRMIWFFLSHKFTRISLDIDSPGFGCPIWVHKKPQFPCTSKHFPNWRQDEKLRPQQFCAPLGSTFCHCILRKCNQIVQWDSHKQNSQWTFILP